MFIVAYSRTHGAGEWLHIPSCIVQAYILASDDVIDPMAKARGL
ncbi:MAG: hypothetical protein OJF49_001772 [Ktedonobacterales bacterium]|nr:MAG: hypothetical protein OJF49_001772 [Ktedonobacterales bacterium]